MSQMREDLDDHMFLWVVLLLIILVVIPAIYLAKAAHINGFLIALAKMELKAFVPFSEEAQIAWAHISELDPADMTWEQMQGVLRYAGKWARWPLAVLLALLGAVSIYMGRVWGLDRLLNMEKLLRHNAEFFACLRPVLGRGKYLLSTKSFDSGLWRTARTPLQFAVEHGLLTDEQGQAFPHDQVFLKNGLPSEDLPAFGEASLDMAKTLATFQTQLGSRFSGFENLSPCRQAAAAAFLAYAAGDKESCVSILDDISASYKEGGGKAKCAILDEKDFLQRLAALWEEHENVNSEKTLARHNAYELVWFMALLNRARKKGVLASSQFLWLRPLDRPLWYALNQCGGRTAWAEGFAAWAHYTAEEKAGKAMPELQVESVVESLKAALSSQGWLKDTARAGTQPTASESGDEAGTVADTGIEPLPDVDLVYAAAEEELEEYDANVDPQLAQEQY